MSTIFSWRQLRLAFAVVIAAVLALAGLAMPSQAQPTVANINPDADTSLTIHKYEQPDPAWDPNTNNSGDPITVPGDANPLNGVVFSVQQVTDINLTTVAGWTAAQALTPAEAASGNLGADLGGATGPNGVLEITENLPVGLYLVRETSAGNNNIVSPAAPFLVAIPQPRGEGDWNYKVHVYPKNSLLDAPEKDVDDSAAFVIGDIVDWTITAAVPVMSEGNQYDSYIITDQLDERLGFAGATVNLNGVALDAGDYTVTPAVTTPTTAGELVTITLTESGLIKLRELDTAGTITVDLQTKVLSIGENGIIPNKAIVFVNDPNQDSQGTPTDIPETKWGALQIIKHAKGDESALLKGAVFNLYLNTATPPAAVPGDLIIEDLTTDENGEINVPGLKVGEYVLVETAAPAGYLLDATPRPITIRAGELTVSENVYSVPNEQEPPFNLPLTGGTGTTLFTIAGLVLLVGAGAGYTIMRKRREA